VQRLTRDNGFSLLELLICLSIVTILLLGSISSTQPLITKNNREILEDEIKGAIEFAKLQSLFSGQDLVLTPFSNNKDWSDGMRLYRDKEILREWHWPSRHITITWQGFHSDNYLLFSSDINSNTLNGTFKLTDSDHNLSKLIVNRLGRVRVSKGARS
jgi:prepilin-type N-terminal cleavage/methylation domain-containing protein